MTKDAGNATGGRFSATAKDPYQQGEIMGIADLGDSMGTTLGTGVMQAFPIGFPKVTISSKASRNTRAFVGTKDGNCCSNDNWRHFFKN